MRREDFLYQYLLKYNEYEKQFGKNDAVSFWRKSDESKGTSGLLFMVLRNALVHNTLETISEIKRIGSFSEVLQSLEKCQISSENKIKYMNILFNNEKVNSDFKKKKFRLINTERKDVFKLLQRKDGCFYSSIFFSHTNLLFSTTVTTYNHTLSSKEYFNGYYIEAELYEDKYFFNFFKKDDSVIKHNISLYVYRDFNPKRLYQNIDAIEVVIIKKSNESNIEIKLGKTDIDKMEQCEIKEFLNTYACDSTIREVTREIKTAFKQLNNILHVIGIQNDL